MYWRGPIRVGGIVSGGDVFCKVEGVSKYWGVYCIFYRVSVTYEL